MFKSIIYSQRIISPNPALAQKLMGNIPTSSYLTIYYYNYLPVRNIKKRLSPRLS